MTSNTRSITYVEAINETLHSMMEKDDKIIVIGQGITSPWYVGMTTAGLIDKFGIDRVIDTPVSENSITGIAIGAALAGMRPVLVHPRMDFMYYAMDQIANHAATWHYMFGGQMNVPLTIWAIINRGGEQAAQHSQALQAIFNHIPGLKVVMPATPYDAKGLLISSINDNNPVVYIDDRWLYNNEGIVPEEIYSMPLGKGIIRRKGEDITAIATSYMVQETMTAAHSLEKEGISVEVIDPLSLKPLDENLLIESVKKTGRLIIIDGGWKTGGIGAEISARIAETDIIKQLKSPIVRVALPDLPAPASNALEQAYYPKEQVIKSEIINLMENY